MGEKYRRVNSIILLGPDEIRTPGGVSTIIKLVKAHFKIRHYRTVSEIGVRRYFLIQLIQVFVLFWRAILFERGNVVLVEASESRSFLRKLAYAAGFAISGNKVFIHVHAASFAVNRFNSFQVKFSTALGIRLIVLSDFWKTRFVTLGAEQVYVLPNPVSSDGIFRTSSIKRERQEHMKVGFLGRVGVRKGVDILLEGLGNLELSVDIFGDGEVERFQRIAKQKKLANVKFHGWIDTDNLSYHFACLDVLCLPSRNEGLPLSILEGMAAGLIIIASDIPAIKSVVGHIEGVFLFENENSESLNETLILVNELSHERFTYLSESNVRDARRLFHKDIFLSNLNQILYESE